MPQPIDTVIHVGEDGHLSSSARKMIADYIKQYAGGELWLRLSKPKRSSRANRWYWVAVIRPVRVALLDAGYTGITEDDVHRLFKGRYLGVQTVDGDYGPITKEATTTKLDGSGFGDYIDRIRTDEMVLQLGVVIGEPDTSDWHGFNLSEATC